MDSDKKSFRKILQEETVWPHRYMFKFIILATDDKINQVKMVFPTETEFNLKPSKNGKYVSITAFLLTKSADEVIAYYEKAGKIEGIFALWIFFPFCLHLCKKEITFALLNFGRLAQLVQSTSFTPRGSGVRIPHLPQQKKQPFGCFFVFWLSSIKRMMLCYPIVFACLGKQH